MESTRLAVEHEIERRVADRYSEWFPGHERSGRPRLVELSSRHSCRIYLVRPPGDSAPGVLAKTRLEIPSRPGPQAPSRPTLAKGTLGPTEQAELEYTSLRTIYEAVGENHPRFGAVRPLDLLPEQNTVLMGYLTGAETMRGRLIGLSRLTPWTRAARDQDTGEVWARVGGWLRLFQQITPTTLLPVRQGRREDVADQFLAYQEFLAARVGASAIAGLGDRGAELAAAVFPDLLPTAAGHGDYAPRNMFVGSGGRLTVFDPLPRLAVPAQDDLCRFLVGMRLLGLQLHTHGVAYAAADLERRESAAIAGYYADRPVPAAELRCYQAMILLDKWSALVQPSGRGLRTRVRRTSTDLAARYLAGQVRRLLDLATAAADGSSLR